MSKRYRVIHLPTGQFYEEDEKYLFIGNKVSVSKLCKRGCTLETAEKCASTPCVKCPWNSEGIGPKDLALFLIDEIK